MNTRDEWVCEPLNSGERNLLLQLWPLMQGEVHHALHDFEPLAALRAGAGLAGLDGARVELQALATALHGNGEPLQALVRTYAEKSARAGVPARDWYTYVARARRELTFNLASRALVQPQILASLCEALARLGDCILGWIRDEYRRVREEDMEAVRCKEQQALLHSERRFTRLSESGILGILVCDIYGNLKDANETLLSMLGYCRAELLSGAIGWTDLTPPEWAHLDKVAVDRLTATGVTGTWEKEYFRKDGTRVPILVGVAMLNDTDCIAFVLDISERRRVEQLRQRSAELEAQNRRILESSRLQHEFLANMSHELRTPLNSIIGFADILYDGEVPAESPKQHEFLGHILRSGKHLLQVINDVLDLAKVEAGKLEFRPETVDVAQMFEEVVSVFRATAEERGIEMLIDVESGVDMVVLDPNRLKQVLYNYTSNALKFTPKTGSVTLLARVEDADSFRIEVRDTGIGIAATDLCRLFKQFEQLDSGTAKKHAGTGLGLALTKRIVECQAGIVGATSVLGQGSVFYAVLPRRYVPSTAPSEPAAPMIGNQDGAAVLVVEDDSNDRAVLVRLLSGAGYHVDTADTGARALHAMFTSTFSAVTLDLLLPDMTGLEVLHRMRMEGPNRDTPVIVVSGVSDQGIVTGFPVHDYLRKPCQGSDLLQSLERAGVNAIEGDPILVVDDDPAARELLQTLIDQRGFRVRCCCDGEDALAAARARKPSAIILDLMMPKVDGFEFLHRFRMEPGNSKVPVIVWTMKDLTERDHRRLARMGSEVIEKGRGKPLALVDHLHAVLQGMAVT